MRLYLSEQGSGGLGGAECLTPRALPPKTAQLFSFLQEKTARGHFLGKWRFKGTHQLQGAELQPCCSRFEKADIYLCVQSGF